MRKAFLPSLTLTAVKHLSSRPDLVPLVSAVPAAAALVGRLCSLEKAPSSSEGTFELEKKDIGNTEKSAKDQRGSR